MDRNSIIFLVTGAAIGSICTYLAVKQTKIKPLEEEIEYLRKSVKRENTASEGHSEEEKKPTLEETDKATNEFIADKLKNDDGYYKKGEEKPKELVKHYKYLDEMMEKEKEMDKSKLSEVITEAEYDKLHHAEGYDFEIIEAHRIVGDSPEDSALYFTWENGKEVNIEEIFNAVDNKEFAKTLYNACMTCDYNVGAFAVNYKTKTLYEFVAIEEEDEQPIEVEYDAEEAEMKPYILGDKDVRRNDYCVAEVEYYISDGIYFDADNEKIMDYGENELGDLSGYKGGEEIWVRNEITETDYHVVFTETLFDLRNEYEEPEE